MSLWNLKTKARLTLAEILARTRQSLQAAQTDLAGRALDLSESEDRVLMSAVPMAVVPEPVAPEAVDVAALDPSAGVVGGETVTEEPGLSDGEQLEFVLTAVDQQLTDVADAKTKICVSKRLAIR